MDITLVNYMYILYQYDSAFVIKMKLLIISTKEFRLIKTRNTFMKETY